MHDDEYTFEHPSEKNNTLKYYFVSFQTRSEYITTNPTEWQPNNGVLAEVHPVIWQINFGYVSAGSGCYQHNVLLQWQEISKEQYDQFAQRGMIKLV